MFLLPDHVGITVSSLSKSGYWYSNLFDLYKCAEESIHGPAVDGLYGRQGVDAKLEIYLSSSCFILELFEFKKPSTKIRCGLSWEQVGFTHLAFKVVSLEQFAPQLESINTDFLVTPQDAGTHKWAFLQDPDGNLIEIIEYTTPLD